MTVSWKEYDVADFFADLSQNAVTVGMGTLVGLVNRDARSAAVVGGVVGAGSDVVLKTMLSGGISFNDSAYRSAAWGAGGAVAGPAVLRFFGLVR